MDTENVAEFYQSAKGAEYHARRATSRSSGAQALRRGYFEGLSGPEDVLLDFGCATGEVAAGMIAKVRWGVEVNEVAAAEARGRLDRVVLSLDEIADGSIDRLMSFHAIEHVADPIGVFAEFHRVLKPGGMARLIVPYEAIGLNRQHRHWRPGDRDMHLFAWTPLTFGNALTSAGLSVQTVRVSHFAITGKIGRVLGPLGMTEVARWINSLRRRRVQLIADVTRP